MAWFMYDVTGEAVDEPDAETVRQVLDGLDSADAEHPDVSLTHESGWCLSAFADGSLVWENTADDGTTAPVELRGTGRADVLRLFGLLVTGVIPAIRRLPWTAL